MPDFDSFDTLTSSDPRDSALPVEITVDGETLTLPWRVDGRATEIARDRHDTPFSEVLDAVGRVVGGVDQDVLDEFGVESTEDLADLSEEDREALAEHVERERDISSLFHTTGLLLWIGFVRFEPSLSQEKVFSLVDPSTINELPLAQMTARITPSADPDAPDVEPTPNGQTSGAETDGEDGEEGK